MATKLNSIIVHNKLQQKNLNVFSLLDFARLFDKNKEASRQFIRSYIDKGLFVRIKKGLFILKNNPPSYELIANKLYSPSYISLQTALSVYGIIPETVYSITSITSKSTREFGALGLSFTYNKIKQTAFTGYELQKKSDKNAVLFAVPEKALIDFLYFVVLKKMFFNDRLDISKLPKSTVLRYAKLFNNQKLIKLVNLIWKSWDDKNHQLVNLEKINLLIK